MTLLEKIKEILEHRLYFSMILSNSNMMNIKVVGGAKWETREVSMEVWTIMNEEQIVIFLDNITKEFY